MPKEIYHNLPLKTFTESKETVTRYATQRMSAKMYRNEE